MSGQILDPAATVKGNFSLTAAMGHDPPNQAFGVDQKFAAAIAAAAPQPIMILAAFGLFQYGKSAETTAYQVSLFGHDAVSPFPV